MIYAVSDLHGYPLEKFKAILDKVGFSSNDFLYILGDVIDRGTDGVKILKWLMSRPNAQLILGNHEQMMLGCAFLFDEINDTSISRLTTNKLNAYANWTANGGQATIDALSAIRTEEIWDIFDYLREAPLFETLTVNGRDFILTHSGLGEFDKNKKLTEYTSFELIWTRPAIDQKYFDDITTVFGHTPTLFYGDEYQGRAIVTDTWVNIDVGAGYGFTPMLLRLDDMKEFYFD